MASGAATLANYKLNIIYPVRQTQYLRNRLGCITACLVRMEKRMDGKRGSFPRAFMLHLLKKFIPRRIKRIIKDWLGIFELQADSNDIDYCYRLLLGRIPDPEGRSFFLEKTKSGVLNVASLVQSFVYSEEFRKRRLFHFQPIPATGPIFVEVEGFGMYAAPDDSGVGNLLLKDGHYERHLTARFKETLRPGMVFLDIGANIGYYSLLAAKLIGPGGKVISFEPVQYNCNLLFLSARRNGFLNIDVMSMAVYERSAVFQYIDTGSNGYLKEIEESADEGLVDGLLVRTVRLDDTLKDLERPDVTKIDVEGAEYRALAGAL